MEIYWDVLMEIPNVSYYFQVLEKKIWKKSSLSFEEVNNWKLVVTNNTSRSST